MIERFSGPEGADNLVAALLRQAIVNGNRPVAEQLAAQGEITEFHAGDTIVAQNDDDNDVFLIINGTVDVFVNHQRIAQRGGGDVVGEMVVVNPTARRSATLKASTETIALKLSALKFEEAGRNSVEFWRYLASVTGDRLRERAKFHLPANETPIMFMGSSVEGLAVAKEIESGLKHASLLVRAWYSRGVFGPSATALEDLLEQVDSADFALFVFGPDDSVISRDDDYMAPRDNVIFEMGLFIGRLGRNRVFMVKDQDTDLKIPTDLTGVTPIGYKQKPGGNLADAVGTVCTELESVINTKGVVSHRMKV